MCRVSQSVLVAQSCPTLWDPMDCSTPGFSVRRILQARTLEWVAIFFLGDLPNPGIDPGFPTLQADSLTSEPPGKPLWRIVSLLNTFCGPVLHIGSAAVYKYVTRVPRDYTLDEETQKWSSKRIITFWVMKH